MRDCFAGVGVHADGEDAALSIDLRKADVRLGGRWSSHSVQHVLGQGWNVRRGLQRGHLEALCEARHLGCVGRGALDEADVALHDADVVGSANDVGHRRD